MLRIALLVVAVVLFILAAINVGPPRVNLGWLGAASATLALLVH